MIALRLLHLRMLIFFPFMLAFPTRTIFYFSAHLFAIHFVKYHSQYAISLRLRIPDKRIAARNQLIVITYQRIASCSSLKTARVAHQLRWTTLETNFTFVCRVGPTGHLFREIQYTSHYPRHSGIIQPNQYRNQANKKPST